MSSIWDVIYHLYMKTVTYASSNLIEDILYLKYFSEHTLSMMHWTATTVTVGAYISSKQLLLFIFASQ